MSPSLVGNMPPNDLANNFDNFFIQKIEGITKSLDALQSTKTLDCENKGDRCACAADECHCAIPVCATLTDFKLLSQDQVAQLMHRAAAKSCPLYPMPTSVVLQVIDVLLHVITLLINLSFEKGHFAKGWSEAHISPLLKRCGLDIVYKNFRPVSNLPYVSKLSERAAALLTS